MHTGIHASSGIQTHDPSVRGGKDISCLRPPLLSALTTVCLCVRHRFNSTWQKKKQFTNRTQYKPLYFSGPLHYITVVLTDQHMKPIWHSSHITCNIIPFSSVISCPVFPSGFWARIMYFVKKKTICIHHHFIHVYSSRGPYWLMVTV
jgi:hypothetical protein